MPRIDNDLVKGTSGKFGKDLIYKTRKDKTFISKYPDMSQVKLSKNQTKNRNLFAEAVKYASELMKDPVRAAAFQLKKDESLYLAAIKQYMQSHLDTAPKGFDPQFWTKELVPLGFNARQIKTALFIHKTGILTNADCRELHNISKPTATRDLQVLISKKIIEPSGIKGAGATYKIGSWWDHPNGEI